MHQVQVCVNACTVRRLTNTKTIPVRVGQTAQKLHSHESVQGPEIGGKPHIITLGYLRGTKIQTNSVIRDFSEKHACFDEKQKWISVLRRVNNQRRLRGEVLRIIFNCNLWRIGVRSDRLIHKTHCIPRIQSQCCEEGALCQYPSRRYHATILRH